MKIGYKVPLIYIRFKGLKLTFFEKHLITGININLQQDGCTAVNFQH